MTDAVRDTGGVGQVEGVGLEGQQVASLELADDVLGQGSPDVDLANIEAVEIAQVLDAAV